MRKVQWSLSPIYLQSPWWLHGVLESAQGFFFCCFFFILHSFFISDDTWCCTWYLIILCTEYRLNKGLHRLLVFSILGFFGSFHKSQFWQREQDIKATPKSFIFPQNHLFLAVPDSFCACAVYLRRCAGWATSEAVSLPPLLQEENEKVWSRFNKNRATAWLPHIFPPCCGTVNTFSFFPSPLLGYINVMMKAN